MLFRDLPVHVSPLVLSSILARVRKGAPGECWLSSWRAGVGGYPEVRALGRFQKVHRVVYELTIIGPVHPGLHVLHKCDVRRCCNPAHLFQGTQADNMRDMVARGRSVRGRKLPRLSAEVVLAIRKSSETLAVLSKRHGLNIVTVWKVRKGLTHRNVFEVQSSLFPEVLDVR